MHLGLIIFIKILFYYVYCSLVSKTVLIIAHPDIVIQLYLWQKECNVALMIYSNRPYYLSFAPAWFPVKS